MQQVARRQASYDDVLKAPEHLVAEIVDGELYTSPRPASPHAVASSRLGGDLMNPFDRGRGGPGGWVILDEPELHLGDHVLVPDLAGWRRDRMPAVPDAPFFTLSPDWCCEVLSESTRRLDRVRKLPIYAEHRVAHTWLIDPNAQTLEVFRLDGTRWVLIGTHSGRDVVRAEPFDAIELDLAGLWIAPQSD